MPIPLVPLLAAGIATAIVGNAMQKNANAEATEQNLRSQKDLIDYQNAYNLPKNQVKRLEDAGVNPAHIYGSGGITSQVMPSASGSDIDTTRGGNQLITAMSSNVKNLESFMQMDNIAADTHLKNTQAGLTKAQEDRQYIENSLLPYMMSAQFENTSFDTLLKQSNIEVNKANKKYINEMALKINQETLNLQKDFEILGEKLREQSSRADIAEIEKEFAPAELQAKINKLNSSIAVDYKTCEQLSELTHKLVSEKEQIDLNTEITRITQDYVKRKMASEANTALNTELMSENELKRQQSGQIFAEYLEPAKELLGTFGSVIKGSAMYKFVDK